MAADDGPPLWAVRLRAERERRSWNKHEMARRLHKATGRPYPPVTSLVRQILGWEKGEHFPRDWTTAYAAAFGLPEDVLFPPSGRVAACSEDDMRRRALLGVLGATAATGLTRLADTPDGGVPPVIPTRPSGRDTDVIREMLRSLVASDRQFGGAHARKYATEYLGTVIRPRLHEAAGSAYASSLFAVSVEFTLRVSAMHLDVGQDESSLAFLSNGLAMAQHIEDPTLTAWVLSRRGEYELGQAVRARRRHDEAEHAAHVERAVDYAGGATRLARKASPSAQSFLRAKEALAWSAAGDRAETERSLGAMWDSYSRAGTRPEPSWMDVYGLGNLQHEAARCYCNLGLGEQAVQAAESSLSVRATRRPKALSLGILAIGCVQTGRISEACRVTRQMLELAAPLVSRRVVVRLGDVLHALSPYRHRPDVAELYAESRPVLARLPG